MATQIAFDSAQFLKLLADDLNELTGPMARQMGHITTETLLGAVDGVQISLKVTRDEDEFMDDDTNKNVITKAKPAAKKRPPKHIAVKEGHHYETASGTSLGPFTCVDVQNKWYKAGNDLRRPPVTYRSNGVPLGEDDSSRHRLVRDVTVIWQKPATKKGPPRKTTPGYVSCSPRPNPTAPKHTAVKQ